MTLYFLKKYPSSWMHIKRNDFSLKKNGKKNESRDGGGLRARRTSNLSCFSCVDFFVMSCFKFVIISHMSTTWVNYGLYRSPHEMKSRLHCKLELSSNIAWYMIHLDGKLLLYISKLWFPRYQTPHYLPALASY